MKWGLWTNDIVLTEICGKDELVDKRRYQSDRDDEDHATFHHKPLYPSLDHRT